MMHTCFLVLGNPRSGTSATAGILHRLGINMGDSFIPDDVNWCAKGFYHDADFDELINQLLWPEQAVKEHPVGQRILEDLHNLIISKNSRGFDWGVKNNYLGYIIHEFEALDNVKIITTQRDFSQSFQSWSKVDGNESEFMKVSSAVKKALEQTRHPIHVIDFDQLLDNTEETVIALAEYVGYLPNSDAIQFVDSSLRRF